MFSEPNDYYFSRASQGLQPKYDWTNTAAIFENSGKISRKPGKQKHLNKIILEKTFAMHFTIFTEKNL